MGSDVSPSFDLSGIGIPIAFSTTLAEDHKTGTDYTEAERRPQAATWEGTGRIPITLEATGEIDSDVTFAPQVRIAKPGMPGPKGAAVIYQQSSGGSWYGADLPWRITGYQGVYTGQASDYVDFTSCVLTDLGTVVAVGFRSTGSGTNSQLRIERRPASTKAWSSVQQYTPADTDPDCLVGGITVAPDGALHVYWMSDFGPARTVGLYTSDDDGVTWRLASIDVGVDAVSSPTDFRIVTLGGQVAIFTGNGDTKQYVSYDGGYNFEIVGLQEANAYVVDARVVGDHIVAITNEFDSTANTYIRTLGSLSERLFDGDRTVLETNIGAAAGGFLVAQPSGTVHAFVLASGPSVQLWTSYDGGSTWEEIILPVTAATYPSLRGQAVYYRGEAIAVTVEANGSGARSGAYLVETRYGGNTDVTLATARAPDGYIGGNIYSWTPAQTLAEAGYANNDTGAPTRTRTFEMINITTGAGDTAQNVENLIAGGQFEVSGTVDMKVNSGTAFILAKAAPCEIQIDLTSTGIRAYDSSGSAPSYTTHNIADFLQIRWVINGTDARATVWYRESDADEERGWTELTNISGITTGLSNRQVSINVAASSDADFRYIEWDSASGVFGSGLADGIAANGTETNGVELSSTASVFLTGGIYVRASGGPGRYDLDDYTIPIGGSPYQKNNLLPTVASSPSRAWRSSGTSSSPLASAELLKFTLDAEQEAATLFNTEVVAYYLDRLVGVPYLTIRDAGVTIQSVDLRTTVAYTHTSGVITMSSSGSTTNGPWVMRDALRGGYFEFDNGEVRKIVGNTSGSVSYGSTVAEHRVVIRLEGIDTTEDASGTAGKIWPPRALLLHHLRGDRSMQRLEFLLPASPAPGPEGNREIGTLGVFEVHVLGRAFDRTVRTEVIHPTTVSRQDDGSSSAYAWTEHAGGVVEYAFVRSHTDLYQVRLSSSTPDYVTASDNGSALPAGSRYAVPLDMEGVYREIRGGKTPVLGLPRIPRDSGSGDAITAYTLGGFGALEAIYGRWEGSSSREMIDIGMHLSGDGARYPTIAIRREV